MRYLFFLAGLVMSLIGSLLSILVVRLHISFLNNLWIHCKNLGEPLEVESATLIRSGKSCKLLMQKFPTLARDTRSSKLCFNSFCDAFVMFSGSYIAGIMFLENYGEESN